MPVDVTMCELRTEGYTLDVLNIIESYAGPRWRIEP